MEEAPWEDDMKTTNNTPEDFRALYKETTSQEVVDSDAFLHLAKQAVATVGRHWEAREEVAYFMTNVWANNYEKWDDPRLQELGEQFSYLEVPDKHVDLNGSATVRDKWDQLRTALEDYDQS